MSICIAALTWRRTADSSLGITRRQGVGRDFNHPTLMLRPAFYAHLKVMPLPVSLAGQRLSTVRSAGRLDFAPEAGCSLEEFLPQKELADSQSTYRQRCRRG